VKLKRKKACSSRLFFNGGGHVRHAHADAQFLLEWQGARR
jgi:hypothetical protein